MVDHSGYKRSFKENQIEISSLVTRINELSKMINGMATKRDIQISEERLNSLFDSKLSVFKNTILHESLENPLSIRITKSKDEKCVLPKVVNEKINQVKEWVKEELRVFGEKVKGNEETLNKLKENDRLVSEVSKRVTFLEDGTNTKLIKLSEGQETTTKKMANIELSYKTCMYNQKQIHNKLKEESEKLNKMKKIIVTKVTHLLAQLENNKRSICSTISKALFTRKEWRTRNTKLENRNSREEINSLCEGSKGIFVSDESISNLTGKAEDEYKTPLSKRDSLKESSISIVSEEDREFLRIIKDSIMDKCHTKDEFEDSFYSARSHSSLCKENNYIGDPFNGGVIDI